MKNRKLLVRVSCTTKKFYLEPPTAGRNDYHIRFTPPRAVREKLGFRERIRRTTGRSEIEPAKAVARQIIESFWKAEAIDSVKQRSETAQMSEVYERYRAGARTIPDKEELKEATINANIHSMERIISKVTGRNGDATADVLTGDLLEKFKVTWLAAVDRNDLQAMGSAKQTVNGYIRQGRSIFGPDYMKLYADLKLPELSGFRAVRLFKTRDSARYVPIPQGVIDAMEAEIRAQRTTRPDLYLGFYFMLWLGMRKSEVLNARLEWLVEWPTQVQMSIVRRAYFKPKGIDGSVPVAPALLADIRELSGACDPMDYLIPAATVTDRANAIGRDLSALVRKHVGAGRRKTCHDLRKHAISMVLMRTRSYVDTLKFSRHADVRTLRNHYEAFLDDLAPIASSNWRDAA